MQRSSVEASGRADIKGHNREARGKIRGGVDTWRQGKGSEDCVSLRIAQQRDQSTNKRQPQRQGNKQPHSLA